MQLNVFKLKSLIYQSGIILQRCLWRVLGGRNIIVFGEKLRLCPETIFPSYLRLRLPRGEHRSEIVRYADYVQFHSIINFISKTESPVVVDFGAHHGAYAIVLGKLLQKKGGKLIAAEPNPKSFEILKKNVSLNNLQDTVVCEKVAVSDKPGKFHMLLADSQSRISAVPQKAEGTLVETLTLEQLLSKQQIRVISLLMIDVEGAELLVLKGIPWHSVNIGKIFCELHPYAWKYFNYNGMDLKQFLSKQNFRCVDMYLQEHIDFSGDVYIGPTVFMTAEK